MVMECVEKLNKPAEHAPERDQSLPPVEEIVPDKTDIRRSGSRNWLLYTLPLLACIGFGFYFFYIKKDIPVAVEPHETVVKQETTVVFIPKIMEVQPVVVEPVEPVVPVVKSKPVEVQLSEEENEPQMIEVAEKPTEVVEVKEVLEVKEVTPVIQEKEASLEEKPVKVILGLQSNSLKLTSKANIILLEFVDTLLHYPDAKILVKGYVSSDNDTLENMQLSEERAASVRQLLIEHGVDAAQIEARGMGIQDPIATNSTSSGRLKNRRVEIEFISGG